MDRISDTASQMFDFVNQSMSWKTATVTVGGLALLAYQNEKRERLAHAANPSLMKVTIPSVQPSLRRERSLSRALRTSRPTGGIRKRSSGDATLMRSGPIRLSAQYKRNDGRSCMPPHEPLRTLRPKPKKNARFAKFLEAVTGALKEYLGYESLPNESMKKPERVLVGSGFSPAPGALFGPKKPELQSPFAVQSKPSGPVLPHHKPTGQQLKSDFDANIFGSVQPESPKSTPDPKQPDSQSPFTFQPQPSGQTCPRRGSTCTGCNRCPGDKSFDDSCYANVCGPFTHATHLQDGLNAESTLFGGVKPELPEGTPGPKQPGSQSPSAVQSQPSRPKYPDHLDIPSCSGYDGGWRNKLSGNSYRVSKCGTPRVTRSYNRSKAKSMLSESAKGKSSETTPGPKEPDASSLSAREPYYANWCGTPEATRLYNKLMAESILSEGAEVKSSESTCGTKPLSQRISFFRKPETPEAAVPRPTRGGPCNRPSRGECGRRLEARLQARRTSRAQKQLGFSPFRTVDPNKNMYGAVAPGDEQARADLAAKIENYQNSTVCDAETTSQNTHQPWRLVSAYHVVRLIPFATHPDYAESFFPQHFHTTFNVVAWVLQQQSHRVISDDELVGMLMKFGSDLKGKWVDVEYMVSYDHPAEWDEMQREYWGAIESLKVHTIPSLGVERVGNDLVTAGEKEFYQNGWEMELPKGMRGNQAGRDGFGSRRFT